MNKKEKKPYLTAVEVEKRFSGVRTAMAAGVSVLVCFLLIAFTSPHLGQDIITFLTAPLSSLSRFSSMLLKLNPLLFASCAICILFSADNPNLSVEGAFYIGALTATLVGVLPGIPPVLHFILMALGGAVGATIVLLIPALANYKFGANMLVCSLMLNYVCTWLGNYLVLGPMRDPQATMDATRKIALSAKLPKFINKGAAQVHIGVFIGIAVVAFTWFILYKSNFGYQSRTVGANPNFARFSGINVGKVVVLGSVLAGSITGLGAACEVSGYYERLRWMASPGYGWDAVMIATLARNNPKWVIPGALFLAYIRTSADVLNMTSPVPVEVVEIAQQVIIVMIAARGLLRGVEKKAVIQNAQKQMAVEAAAAKEA